MYNYLIVGAGLSGCVLAERIATQLNRRVLLVDKRSHIGGNCYDYYDCDGLLIHKYGPHWFHTNDKSIFEYLSKFTEWRFHDHKVKSFVDGMLVPFPINIDTINQLYKTKYNSTQEIQDFYDSVKVKNILRPKNAEEFVVSQIGYELFEKFYKNYSIKQWGISPRELKASITARIPIRVNKDDRYFTDYFQAIPKHGYTKMFENMISRKNIHVEINTDFRDLPTVGLFDRVIYTGCIDSYFNYLYGELPYRSLEFKHETLNQEFFQECQQINYPNDFDFTRVIEWKHATGQIHEKTSITREFPVNWDATKEPYYSVHTNESEVLFKKYKEEADKLKTVHFCGRLAEFKYYNMDQVVARALTVFRNEIMKNTNRHNFY